MPIVMDRRDVIKGLAAGTVVAVASGCSHNPALNRSQFMLVSDDELAAMSAGTWDQILQTEKLSTDRTLNKRVERIGTRIVDSADAPDKTWEFHVIESDTVNAFVLPGGQVAFYRGILDIMDNDDQIATVMGHEVGHVAGRHAAERASQRMAAGVALTAATIAVGASGSEYTPAIAAVLGAGVTFGVILPYSRQHEYEADRLGVDYMANADYRPNEAVRFWEKMAERSGHTSDFMSTHPADNKRIDALQQHIATMRA
jgi:predicted Zn-dependent protease